ncbi:MAG: carboxymuconolactone decarboxylase family protein [Candidatus Dadabacteria bacterium]|nr:MAG: carboxymuconolactone decarboxylase family protein [Candidatus Dadabacteria bacterium]
MEQNVDKIFEAIQQKMGFVPNVLKEMSKSKAALNFYLSGSEILEQSSLTPAQLQAVMLAASVFNECKYCTTAHSAGAKKAGISEEDIERMKRGALPQSPELKGVVRALHLLVEQRGWLTNDHLKALEEEGVNREKLYEVICTLALKFVTNYINHIAHTEIDKEFLES